MIGTCVGSYRITGKVSVGGMGVVYRAEHTLIGKAAAVKILHPELSGSKDLIQRFFNEAKATTTTKHPGIVDVFDYGYMKSGHAYIIMEFLEGMSLARRIKMRGRMAEGDAAMMLRALCSALSAAHAKGIVHRDLKPDNIYLISDPDSPTGERPKILDFGIAKLTEPGLAGTATKTGAVMGTPTYMSPEQCKGTGEVDHRADLYAIGCIYYELVCGRPPFINRGGGELIGAHLYLQPDPPSKHGPVTPASEALILSLLAKEPAERPQTARELGQRLYDIAQKLGWVPSPTGAHELIGDHSAATLPTTASDSIDDRPTTTPASAPLVDKPTTLGGAAGESSMNAAPPRSRKWIGVVAGMAVVAAGLGIAFMVRGTDDGAPAAARATAPTAPAPAAAPTPPPAPAPVADPKPAPAPDPKPAPDPAPAVEPPKPAEAPVAKPVVQPPVVQPPVVHPRPHAPITKPPPPPPPKPADPPKPPPKTNPLIETDL